MSTQVAASTQRILTPDGLAVGRSLPILGYRGPNSPVLNHALMGCLANLEGKTERRLIHPLILSPVQYRRRG